MQQSSVVESVMNRFKFVRSEVTDLYIILWRDNGTAFLILSFPMKVHMLSVQTENLPQDVPCNCHVLYSNPIRHKATSRATNVYHLTESRLISAMPLAIRKTVQEIMFKECLEKVIYMLTCIIQHIAVLAFVLIQCSNHFDPAGEGTTGSIFFTSG